MEETHRIPERRPIGRGELMAPTLAPISHGEADPTEHLRISMISESDHPERALGRRGGDDRRRRYPRSPSSGRGETNPPSQRLRDTLKPWTLKVKRGHDTVLRERD